MSACFVCHTISLGMLRYSGSIRWSRLDCEPKDFLSRIAATHDVIHSIGDKEIAQITGFPYRREPIEAEPGDILLVCQYRGPKLRENGGVMPVSGKIFWYIVDVID